MSEYLFIGGIKDGQRLAIPEDRCYVLIPRRVRQAISETIDCEQPKPIESQSYKRFGIPFLNIQVFALAGMGMPEIMQSLVEHYRPNVEDNNEAIG